MDLPQSRVVRVAPMASSECPAKGHTAPEKTAHALSDDAFDLKAGLTKVANKLKFMKYTNKNHKLTEVSAFVLIFEFRSLQCDC